MRVLLAFDKFKDSLTAPAACAIAADCLRTRQPTWELDLCPLADGGEGFAEILTRAADGQLIVRTVTGPRGAPTTAHFGLVPLNHIPAAARTLLDLPAAPADARIAIIEMASASGLALLSTDARDPWHASAQGTGQLIRAAADLGAAAILLGVGGSATNDLGLTALAELGFSFHDGAGVPIHPPLPATWPRIAAIRGSALPLPPIRIACDVTNPLLGPRGAAAVYGPQKGLRATDHARLEAESARLAHLLCAHTRQSISLLDVSGAGAAGGIAFGLMAATGARLLPGFDLVSSWLDLEKRLAAADIVITGEGRFDASSLEGKGPGAIAARALALTKPVLVFAGAVLAASRPGLSLHAITPPGTPLPEALRTAPQNLAASVQRAFS
ncbi:glycerate kinase [Horticoccus luteus]|uniref:Glycerate kinase n=1 Tax=Horticoccus luteus TaxID=2862869 RepID=A0A8F9TTZ5_9BACT|nr:glycerate kinase [Horticoccus luteus]QYM78057.1 glycerate kinase [Horticoccus luteus]